MQQQEENLFTQNPNFFTISGPNGISMKVMDWGATILDLITPVKDDNPRHVLLRLKELTDWKRQKVAVNAIVGRFANRIANSSFTIDNVTYQLKSKNRHCLHGGDEGYNRRRFNIKQINHYTLECTLFSPDGDMGFPGNFKLKITYSLANASELLIKIHGECDQKTYASITSHCYFNLNGYHSLVRNHKILSPASQFLDLTTDGIPTGKILQTEGTAFDFSKGKKIGDDLENVPYFDSFKGYDHPFITPKTSNGEFLILSSDDEKLNLAISSDYPAFQLYIANFMSSPGHEMPALDDKKNYESYSAVCIEPEYFPDAPHLKEFKEINPLVEPDKTLDHYIKFRFF